MISPTLASDFDETLQRYNERAQDWLYSRVDWYVNGRPRTTNIRSIKQTFSWFPKENRTCAFGERSGRYSDNDEDFVNINGVDIPRDAITFAGVFDVMNDMEMAVFRGMFCSIHYVCHQIHSTLIIYAIKYRYYP